MLLIRCPQCAEVVVKPFVCDGDQSLIEPSLICAALVAADQQNCLALGVKGERYAPHLAGPGKPQVLHVGVLRALQGIHCWPPQAGTKIPQQQGVRQQLVLQALRQGCELNSKVVVKKDVQTMRKYVLKAILMQAQ